MNNLTTYNNSEHCTESFNTVLEPLVAYGNRIELKNELLIVAKPFAARQFVAAFFQSGSVSTTLISDYEIFFPNDTSVYVSIINDINYLEHAFNFVNEKEIKSFLMMKPELISALLSLQSEIFSRLGFVIPRMELVTDIELPDWKTIFVNITSSENFENAFEKVNDLIQRWAFLQSKEFRKLVTISLA